MKSLLNPTYQRSFFNTNHMIKKISNLIHLSFFDSPVKFDDKNFAKEFSIIIRIVFKFMIIIMAK